MGVEFRGHYSKWDLFRAVYLANKPSLFKSAIHIVLGILVIGLFTAYFFIVANKDFYTVNKFTLGRQLLSLCLIIFYFVYPYVGTFLTVQKNWKDPSMRGLYSGIISINGIQYSGNPSAIEWRCFAKKSIRSNMILLLTSDGVLCFFPRSFFASVSDWQRAKQFADYKIVEAK